MFFLKVPIHLCLNLTIPVVELDEKKHNWSRRLQILQCLCSPLFCVCATKGKLMRSDLFLFKSASKLFVHAACVTRCHSVNFRGDHYVGRQVSISCSHGHCWRDSGRCRSNDVITRWTTQISQGNWLKWHYAITIFLTSSLTCIFLLQLFSFMGFIASVIWIYSTANEIVNLLRVSLFFR
jgi:hypothetical protein